MADRLADLETFVRVSEFKTLSAAADALDCSPSAISKLVTRLEARLGVRLFYRTSRALSLTPEGELFREKAEEAVEAAKQADEAVHARTKQISGVLRIATTAHIAQFFIAPVLADLRQAHPDLQIHLFLRPRPVKLVEYKIDLGIFSGELPDSSYISRRLAPVRWVVCASSNYLAKRGMPLHPQDLLEHDCLNFLPGEEAAWGFRVDGKPFSLAPVGPLRANSGDLLRQFAKLGLGVARVPLIQIREEIDRSELIPLLEAYEEATPEWIFGVYQSARQLTPRAKAFLKFLDRSFRLPRLEP